MNVLPQHIQENLANDKDYYSLYVMQNIEKCKLDPNYLGDVMTANENLIWHSIHKYVGKPEIIADNNGIEKDDIIQLGRVGFIKAIKAFDTTRGIKFSSFAVTAIVREIRCYLRDSANIIRLTRTAHSLMHEIKRTENDYGYLPSVEELADILNESESKISKVLQIGKPVKYLDEQLGNDSNAQLLSYIDLVDDKDDVTEVAVVDKLYVDSILEVIKNKLSPVEFRVLESQLNGYSQTQTAKEQNISQMRVSRIIKKIGNLIKGCTLMNSLIE